MAAHSKGKWRCECMRNGSDECCQGFSDLEVLRDPETRSAAPSTLLPSSARQPPSHAVSIPLGSFSLPGYGGEPSRSDIWGRKTGNRVDGQLLSTNACLPCPTVDQSSACSLLKSVSGPETQRKIIARPPEIESHTRTQRARLAHSEPCQWLRRLYPAIQPAIFETPCLLFHRSQSPNTTKEKKINQNVKRTVLHRPLMYCVISGLLIPDTRE
ncbi:hypothetical protein VTI28DRAFT_8508 [Corynascus sepedonium]